MIRQAARGSSTLGFLEDNGDNEWKSDGFKLDSPDESLDINRFEGSPEFQKKLRALCSEYIDDFSTSVRSPIP